MIDYILAAIEIAAIPVLFFLWRWSIRQQAVKKHEYRIASGTHIAVHAQKKSL